MPEVSIASARCWLWNREFRTCCRLPDVPAWLAGSEDFPLEQNGRERGQAKDEQENRQLVADRIAGLRHADPHVRAGDDEPRSDESDGRCERRVRIVRGKELTQDQR